MYIKCLEVKDNVVRSRFGNNTEWTLNVPVTVEGALEICGNGLHYFKDVFQFLYRGIYKSLDCEFKVYECKVDENRVIYDYDKCCTSSLTLIRELTIDDIIDEVHKACKDLDNDTITNLYKYGCTYHIPKEYADSLLAIDNEIAKVMGYSCTDNVELLRSLEIDIKNTKTLILNPYLPSDVLYKIFRFEKGLFDKCDDHSTFTHVATLHNLLWYDGTISTRLVKLILKELEDMYSYRLNFFSPNISDIRNNSIDRAKYLLNQRRENRKEGKCNE